MSNSVTNSDDKDRCQWIDVAKGIGIILVVYGHVARGAVSAGVPIDPWWFAALDSTIYAFHMPLFFLLSGWFFVGSLKRRGRTDYLLARIATVLYPYILWSLFQGGIELLMSKWTNRPATLAGVLSFGWAPRAQFWFLYTLFIISVIAMLLPWRNPNRSLVALIFTGILGYATQQYWLAPLNFIAGNLIFFAIGVIFGAWAPSAPMVARTSVVVILVSGLTVFIIQSVDKDLALALKLAEAALGMAAVISISIKLASKGFGEALAELGRASMAIFLAHILVASGSRIILAKAFGIWNPWEHVVIGIIVGTLLPWCLWRYASGTAWMALFEMPHSWRRRLATSSRTATA